MTRTLKGFLLKSFQNVFNKIVKQQNSDCTQLQDGTFFAASPSSSSTSVISVIIICSRTRSFYIRNKEKLNEKQYVSLIKEFYIIIHTNSFDSVQCLPKAWNRRTNRTSSQKAWSTFIRTFAEHSIYGTFNWRAKPWASSLLI